MTMAARLVQRVMQLAADRLGRGADGGTAAVSRPMPALA